MKQTNVTQNQTKMVQFRVSEEQYEKLKKSAEVYGLSPSLYVKKMAQNSRLKKAYFSHDDAKKILVELTRQGTNLNQIAKRLNQLDSKLAEDKELLEALRYTYGALVQARKEYQELWRQFPR
ncbi:plasmid mobilization protein [Enterococcus bulliens]